MLELLKNPVFLITIAIILGKILGKLTYKGFSFGASAIMFVGIFLIEILYKCGIRDVEIPSYLFTISLSIFIVSVALVSSKSLVPAFKVYGIKFILLAFVVRGSGAFLIFLFLKVFPNYAYHFAGLSVGALTSSPGLGNAIELAKSPIDMTAAVTSGYIIGYIPGVSSVILSGKIISKLYNKKNIEKETKEKRKSSCTEFNFVKFMLVIALGFIIGTFNINLSSSFSFSLGTTGGCLVSALILGSAFKGFEFNEVKLAILKEFSICAFLALIGLKYGHDAIYSIMHEGLILLPIGIMASITALTSGYLVGKYIFKIDVPLLTGGICGAMTSTPGLASAYEAFEDDEVVTGYGLTYPFGLIYAILLLRLFIN